MKKLLSLPLFICFSVLLFSTGCAYRADLMQGNFYEQKDIDKLRIGMSPEQVRYIFGTPMLTNPFETNKWYYIKSVRKGWSAPEQKTIIIIFDKETNKVKDMIGDHPKPANFYQPLNTVNE